jgi:hypothetical protein
MMTIAWWLSIPVVATLLAILWVTWAGRPKTPKDTHASLQSYQRFRAAMENETSRRRPPANPASGTTATDDEPQPPGGTA